jgi:hypothetical protein
MKRAPLTLIAVPLLLVSWGAAPAWPAGPAHSPEEIVIQVSPQTILLNWKAQGDVKVTVHAEVDFSLFVGDGISVSLEGIPASYIYSDARGDLVAKFPFDKVVELCEVGTATLRLSAMDRNGITYTGSDVVRVIAP